MKSELNNTKLINTTYMVVLISLSLYITQPIKTLWDIIAADEISYLKLGKTLFGEIHFDWGFMYNVWYKFLSILYPSTVDLYYANYRILITFVPLLLFICLVRYKVNSFLAFIISYLYLVSKLNLTTWPFVSDYCCCIMLIYFIIISIIKDEGWKYIILAIFSLILYLVRPEYLIALIIAIVFVLLKNRTRKLRYLVLIPILSILIYVGIQTLNFKGFDRSFFAFAQHYFVTYTIWHKDTKISAYDYFVLAPKIFGTSFTLVGSILYNPLETFRHIITCFGFYILNMLKSFEDFLFPFFIFQKLGKIKHLLFISVTVFLFIYFRKRNKNNTTYFTLTPYNLGILTFFLSAAISNFLIGYSIHYIQLHFILLIIFISIILFKDVNILFGKWLKVATIILCIIFAPSLKKYSFLQVDYKESKYLPIQKLANYINKTNDGKSHFMIAYQTNLHYVFNGNNYNGTDIFSIDKPFFEYLQSKKVDYIYINEQLLSDVKLQKDKQWQLFFNNPQKYGFYKQSFIKTNNYLLIKK